MLVGLTVDGVLKFQAGKLCETEGESSAKGFRARLAGIVGLSWHVVVFTYPPACLWYYAVYNEVLDA